jgi:hypothetical protein
MSAPTTDLDRYLRLLAGATPAAGLIEIRWTIPNGMGHTFTPATRPHLAARTITTLATRTDVYVGVLLRRRRASGRHACQPSHLAFVEIDQPDALARLERYHCPPSAIVASGIICSRRSRGPESVGDGCWRRVAGTACRTGGIRWCRRPR